MDKTLNPNYQISQRTKAAAFDAAFFALIFFLINLLSSFLITNVNKTYVNSYNTVNQHCRYSNLCKVGVNGFLQYEDNELAKTENENLVFCNVLSYYYLNYLSNTNIKTGYEGSKEVIVHDIKWFNEKVLEIGQKDIFKTKTDSSDSISTEIGIFNESFINSNGQDAVYEFLTNKYNEAVKNFYDLSFIKEANNTMNFLDGLVIFISSAVALFVVYILIPIINKYKQTFGKKIFKLVVTRNDIIVSNLIILLRVVPALLVCILISVVRSAMWEIGIAVATLLISSGLMIFTKKNVAVHDMVAGTRVVTIDSYKEVINGNK